MRWCAPRCLGALALFVALAGCGSEAGEPVGDTSEAYTSECPKTTVEGVDVYDGQGTIDWTKVYASGRRFAFIKATQGDYNMQTTFNANWAKSKAAGVLRSPYHFFDPTIDGTLQAQHFLAVVSAAGGLQAGDLPPMLDIECPTSSTQANASPNCEHTGDSGWVPTATLVQRVFDWLQAVEQATGQKAVIYSYPAWFADVGLTDARLAQYPLYIATLASCASVPPPWTSTVFWQYSYTGTVPGIPGQVDLDRFLGTEADLGGFAAGPMADGGTEGGADAARAPEGGASADAESAAESGATGDAADPPIVAASADAGCSCEAAPRGARTPAWAWAALAAAALTRARKRRR